MSIKRKPLEKDILKAVVSYATSLDVKGIRLYFGPGLQSGWPDYLFLIPGGKPLFMEFKREGKKPTPKQQVKIDLLRNLGYDAVWIDSVKAGKIILDVCLKQRKN